MKLERTFSGRTAMIESFFEHSQLTGAGIRLKYTQYGGDGVVASENRYFTTKVEFQAEWSLLLSKTKNDDKSLEILPDLRPW